MPGNFVIMSVLCVYIIVTTAMLPFVCSKYCARFEFPTLPSAKTQYIPAVNTTIAFPFYLVNRSCRSLDNYTVRIYKSFSPTCNVYFKLGKCQEPQQKGVCYCNHSANSFLFMKTMDKADEGEWTWSAIGDDLNKIAECVTTFRITVPAQITNLTVLNNNGQYGMHGKESVMIICSWINGDPPTTVRLIDSRRRELNTSRNSGDISFRYPTIHGDSAGIIHCEANGSSTNMSVRLKSIVHNLTLGGETGPFLADRNKSVPIVCSWENGYPNSSARLTGSDRQELNSSYESGNISYTLAAVDCKNSGIIHCDADGSEKNVSVRLIVKCPPTIMKQAPNTRTVKVGTEPIITFPTHAHTAMLTECKIARVNSTSATIKTRLNIYRNCCLPGTNKSEFCSPPTQNTKGSNFESQEISCSCSLTGETPNMTLTVKMHQKFTEGTGGLWDLSVSNQEGSSHQKFIIEVAAEDSKPDQSLRVVAIVMPITMLAAVVGGVIAYVFHSKENQQKITEIAEFAGLYSTSLPVKRKSDLKVPDDPSPSPDTESSDPTSEESITSTESDEAEESRVQVFNKNSNDDRNMKIVCKGGDMKIVLYIKGRSGKGKSSQVITAAITENDDDDNEITPLHQFCSTKAAKKKSRKRKSAVGEDYLTPCLPRYSTLPPPPESSGTGEPEKPLENEDNASELYSSLAEEHYLTID